MAKDPKFATVPARFENEAELMPILREGVKDLTVAELNAKLNEGGVLNAPVHEYGDYFEDPHVKAVEALTWMEHSGIGRIPVPGLPGHARAAQGDPLAHAPHIGEHSREVLRALGHSDAEVDTLRDRGAVAVLDRAEAAE